MATTDPSVILRLGSHAEKDYFLKTIKLWNGLIVGANLLESAPGATSSLIFKFAGDKNNVPYYVDPMTYAFGAYVERGATKPRTDLDWIKSEQKDRKTKQVQKLYKRSYRALAHALGGPILSAIQNDLAISPGQLRASDIKTLCESTLHYQLQRVRSEFQLDPDFARLADKIPPPAAIFAPYFYIDPTDADAGLALLGDLASTSAGLTTERPVHAVLCTDVSALRSETFLERASDTLIKSGVAGVWVWFSTFYEDAATLEELFAFVTLLGKLGEKMSVFNMHGGYFSLALSRFGMNGVSHGIGYGEQKDVIPVIGQSTPTVRYYLPDLKRRLSVPQIERALAGVGVKTADDFHQKVCGCAICRGVIGTDLKNFSSFGDLHYSTPHSKKKAQTPEAAQRCRFHFLLNRASERDALKKKDAGVIASDFAAAHDKWSQQPTISGDAQHLLRWKAVFSAGV